MPSDGGVLVDLIEAVSAEPRLVQEGRAGRAGGTWSWAVSSTELSVPFDRTELVTEASETVSVSRDGTGPEASGVSCAASDGAGASSCSAEPSTAGGADEASSREPISAFAVRAREGLSTRPALAIAASASSSRVRSISRCRRRSRSRLSARFDRMSRSLAAETSSRPRSSAAGTELPVSVEATLRVDGVRVMRFGALALAGPLGTLFAPAFELLPNQVLFRGCGVASPRFLLFVELPLVLVDPLLAFSRH